jgi:hypothetical protein
VAAIVAVLLTLPAAVVAADGGADADAGGGATYTDSAEDISLKVAPGAWLGRATRIRGRSAELAGRTVAIESRKSRRGGWAPAASVRVSGDGTFVARWKPNAPGLHDLRALAATASSAESRGTTAPSGVKRVTVYRSVTATWYGPGFYGNRTACGQRLTTRTQGVAHKTLPCGTRVAIRVNGRSTVVPVIDRGPYARGVAYDLTGATARRLRVTYTSRIGAAVLSR